MGCGAIVAGQLERNNCLSLFAQSLGELAGAARIAVASGRCADYVIGIDLAGRLGRFRLAFRARAHVFLPLSKLRRPLRSLL